MHNNVTLSDVLATKDKMPNAKLLVHPECRAEVLSQADFIGSTAEIINYVKNSEDKSFIIGTENEITEKLCAECPDKEFITVAGNFICEDMKKITLKDVLDCLREERHEIYLSKEEIAGAKSSLERMVNC